MRLSFSGMVAGSLRLAAASMDFFFKLLGPLLVIAAMGLITGIIFLYFRLIFPEIFSNSPIFLFFHLVFLIIEIPNLYFHYLMAVFVAPGSPPKSFAVENEEEVYPMQERHWSKYCDKCAAAKPPRTHHCHICRKCVLRMDHHCPWIANCVGYYNHRHFVLFLMYLGIGCLYVAFNTFSAALLNPLQYPPGFIGRGGIMLAFVLSTAIFFSDMFMGLFHLYLTGTNQTTIEFYTNMVEKRKAKARGEVWRNAYGLGWKQNFDQVFGPNWWSCLIPYPTEYHGKGMHFPLSIQGGIPFDVMESESDRSEDMVRIDIGSHPHEV